MKTILPKTPGLLRASQGRASKQSKITTTVRIDSDLKARAEEFARANHMDFSTFLTFSLHTTIQNGGKIEPYYAVSEEYAKYLDEIEARHDRGEDKGYGPFEGQEAITFLKTLY